MYYFIGFKLVYLFFFKELILYIDKILYNLVLDIKVNI